MIKHSSVARARRFAAVSVVAAVAIAGLAGCVPAAQKDASPSPSHSASSPAPTTTDAAPSPATSSPVGGTPIDIACDSVVTAQAMYDFNPNFGLDTKFSPKSGTPAATAIADQGVACNWTNQTSGDTITISAAKPTADGLAALKSQAANGTPVTGFGDAAYFSAGSAGGPGRVDVFSGAYWLSAVSVYFGTAADADQLLTSAMKAIG